MSRSEAEPVAFLSRAQWKKIAQSIPLDKLPQEMKQEICDALFLYDVACLADHDDEVPSAEDERKPHKKRRKVAQDAREHTALELLIKCVRDARDVRLNLYRIERDLRPESLVEQAERLAEDAYALQRAARAELEKRIKPKGGRPPMVPRDALAFRLVGIYGRFTGMKPGLSRNPDTRNPDPNKRHLLKPGGPCYRFVSTILQAASAPAWRPLMHIRPRFSRIHGLLWRAPLR